MRFICKSTCNSNKLVPKLSKFLKLNCKRGLVRQSCQHMSLTSTEMDSTAQFSCAFPLPHPFSERSQEIEIQVSRLTQGMYISPVIKKSEHFGGFLGGFTGSTIY